MLKENVSEQKGGNDPNNGNAPTKFRSRQIIVVEERARSDLILSGTEAENIKEAAIAEWGEILEEISPDIEAAIAEMGDAWERTKTLSEQGGLHSEDAVFSDFEKAEKKFRSILWQIDSKTFNALRVGSLHQLVSDMVRHEMGREMCIIVDEYKQFQELLGTGQPQTLPSWEDVLSENGVVTDTAIFTTAVQDLLKPQFGRRKPLTKSSMSYDLACLFRHRETNVPCETNTEVDADMERDLMPYGAMMETILHEFLENAYAAINRNGGDNVTLRARKEVGAYVFEIEDTGIGIPPEQIDRIFVKWFSTKAAVNPKSHGLGLYLNKLAIEQFMSGSLEVESEVGKGTMFRIRIPIPEGI